MDNKATADLQESTPPTFKRWSFAWLNNVIMTRKRGMLIGVLILVLIFLFFADRIVIFVNAGESAVLFKRFRGGTQLDKSYGEGVHIVLPWDHMEVYNVRIQHEIKQFEVLSSNGLKIKVDASIRYRPILENLAYLHQNVGPDYADRIVFPEVEAVVRQIFGQYLPEDIYSSQKFIIQNTVQNAIFEVSERFVDLDELLITRITLPDMIVAAIEEKLEKEQVAQGYRFRLDSERLEAERKRIEASGIRDFQTIVSAGLTENYLRFKGIEATLKLSESNNSKIVVIGGGKDGLPIILDGSADKARIVN